MRKLGQQGFSMIELLVVLLIIGILATVGAPMFLANTVKAKVSEAVAGEGQIRQAERTYIAQNGGSGLVVTSGQGSTYFGSSGAQSSVLGVQIHGNKYFSPESYSIAVPGSWAGSVAGVSSPLDFVITATGSNSVSLTTNTTDGAASNTAVANFIVQMDNAGQIIYSSNGSTWSTF